MEDLEKEHKIISNQAVEMAGASDEIEKSTYSKAQLKSVNKLREEGAEYGDSVPYLKHPLTKSTSSNIWLKIFTIFSGILIVFGTIALIWVLASFIPSVIKSLSELSNNNGTIQELPIIGTLVGLGTFSIWLIVIAIPVIAVTIVVSSLIFLLKLIKINSSFVEEKAHGYVLTNLKTSAMIFGIIFLVFAILGIVLFKIWAVSIVCFIVSLYAFALFAVLQIERNKARIEFEKLPEDAKADYIEYAKALKLVSSKHSSRKKFKTLTANSYGKLAPLIFMLDGFIDAKIVYNNLKNNERYKDTSTRLAKRSLYNLLAFVITTVVSLGIAYWAVTSFFGFWKILILIIITLVILYSFAITFPLALNLAIKQLKLNKKPLGKVAFVLCLIFAIGVVVGAVILFNSI